MKQQAKIITSDEEDVLWSKGVIGTHTPTSLLNAVVFFYHGVYFCLHEGNEHRQLKLSQVELKEVTSPTDSAKIVKCVVYTEHGSKNRKGVIHHLHLHKVVTHFADSTLGERCFVYLMELYVSKLSDVAKEKDLFYFKPKVKFDKEDSC